MLDGAMPARDDSPALTATRNGRFKRAWVTFFKALTKSLADASGLSTKTVDNIGDKTE